MPRGAKLTPHVEDLIMRACVEHPEWISKPKKIQEWVIDNLHEPEKVWGGPNWPGIDVIKNRLREKIRPNFENRPPEIKRLDEEWSLGASDEKGISTEATADLLDVWKHCLAIGHTFTIREAKWVARIHTVIKASQNIYQYRGALLFGYAHEYAIRERISEILDSPMYTRDLDGNLCFKERDWDWIVFRATGMIPRITVKYYNKELSEHNLFGIYFNVASYVAERKMLGVDPNVINNLALGLSEKQSYMLAALLLYLSKGPLWKELSNREHLSILDYLKDLVTKELTDDLEMESFHTKFTYQNLDFSHWHDRPNGLAPEDVLSPDLLKLVGYEVTTHAETIDNPFPHLKNYDYPRHTRDKAVFTLNRNKREGGTE